MKPPSGLTVLGRIGCLIAACFVLACAALPARAATIHYFDAGGATPAQLDAAITAAGHTPQQLADLTNLVGVQVLWITNGDNGNPPAQVTLNAAGIAAFVAGGGVLSYHDRYVAESEAPGAPSDNNVVLPGAAAIVFHRDFTDDISIDILNNTTLVTNGPGGVVTQTNLDGGNSSSHGWVSQADVNLILGTAIFSRTDPTQVVDFFYPFGLGDVYYSTIPLDFYLGGSGNNPPRDNFRFIYAPNELAFQATLVGAAVPVPGPATLALLSVALFGLVILRSRLHA